MGITVCISVTGALFPLFNSIATNSEKYDRFSSNCFEVGGMGEENDVWPYPSKEKKCENS